MALASQHRASHEMLRRKVINTADGYLRSLFTCNALTAAGTYRASLEESLDEYREILVSSIDVDRPDC
jgi:hypothetical protein